MTNYEPTEADIEFLNKLEQGYIGLDKPKVEFTKEDIFFEEPDEN